MVLVIELFTMLILHAEFMLEVGGLLYYVHPIREGLSGVVTMWHFLLGTVTHDRCLLTDVRILLGIL